MVLLTSHLAAVHRDRAQSKQRRLWTEKLEQIPFAWGFELLWYVQLEMCGGQQDIQSWRWIKKTRLEINLRITD